METIYSANSDDITRAYLDSLLIEPRYIDSDLPSLKTTLYGKTFETPIMTAALSHLHKICDDAMCEIARGAKQAGALHWYGMGEDWELEDIVGTGADTVKIIKPHAEDARVFEKLAHAVETGVFATGMDIDHAFSWDGKYDNVLGLEMRPKSSAQLREFIEASKVPFIVKGVLSISDAVKCAEAGAQGILLSHHHNIMPFMVPPLVMLPEIRKELGPDFPLFVDCGIVSGMDAFKALALGADAVCVGRGFMEPLKEGSKGVYRAFCEMNAQLATVMARTGAKTVKEIDPSVIHHRNF